MTRFTPSGGRHILPAPLRARIHRARGDAGAAMELAPEIRTVVGLQTPGNHRRFWRGLAEIGALDLTVARTVQHHLDALGTLGQARGFTPTVFVPGRSTWGVLTPGDDGAPLRAERDGEGRWTLTGPLPLGTLAGAPSHALVTARTSEDGHTLFALRVDENADHGTESPAAEAGVPALAVGPEDWHLSRPGAALAGVGEAAAWWGAATALAQILHISLAETPGGADRSRLWHLGRCDAALFAAGSVLDDLADRDRAATTGTFQAPPEPADALRVRGIVHHACETTLNSVLHAFGLGQPVTDGEPPPGTDGDLARRVRDLQSHLRGGTPTEGLVAVGTGALDGLPTVWAMH